jgi:hypothetical protein
VTVEWPVDPGGIWSARQVTHVLEANREFADRRGLELVVLDVTTHADKTPKCRIQVRCRRHGCAIERDAACPVCKGTRSVKEHGG